MKFSTKGKEEKIKISKSKKKNSAKENTNFRKKLLKVLKSKGKYDCDGESEEGNVTDILDEKYENYYSLNGDSFNVQRNGKANKSSDKEIVQKKKKTIKNKETLTNENEMVQVISSIISAESSPLLHRVMDVVAVDKISGKKSKESRKNIIDCAKKKEVNDKKKKDADNKKIQKNGDNNKIQKNGDNDNKIQKNVDKISKIPVAVNSELRFDNYNFKKSKLNSEIKYKQSVMEIFRSVKLKSAVVKSSDFKLQFNKNKPQSSKTVKETCKVSTQPNNDIHLEDNLMDDSQAIDDFSHTNMECDSYPIVDEPASYKIYTFSKCSILVMRSDVKLYFCGRLKATLLKGNVNIFGHRMDSTTQEIYSLPISSLLFFHSHKHSDKKLDISKLSAYDIPECDSKMLLESIEKSDSVLLLQPNNNMMIDFVCKHFTNFNVFVKKLDQLENIEAFNLLQCQFFTNDGRGLLKLSPQSSNISQNILNNLTSSSKNLTMICGGKNSGKSTLLRYLVNSCVPKTPVLVLDLDPGQPEFTVCGLLSATVVAKPLLGPNFTHLMNPDRSLVLGFINITENEEHYLACIQDLFKYCSAHGKYSNMPWIVNTCGFTGQLGIKLLAAIVNIVQPTAVVELMSNIRRNNFEFNLNAFNMNEYQKDLEFMINDQAIDKVCHNYDYFDVDSYYYQWTSDILSVSRNVEPKEERLLNLLAYFSEISNCSGSILELTPYVISLDDIRIACNNQNVSEKYIYSVINGKLVALCHNDNVDDSHRNVVDMDLFTCYGYGIVRGVDLQQRKIYITTPLTASLVSFVNTLVYSDASPECSSMSMESLPEGVTVPYVTSYLHNTIGKQLMKTPKRKFNPFRLLEIRNNS